MMGLYFPPVLARSELPLRHWVCLILWCVLTYPPMIGWANEGPRIIDDKDITIAIESRFLVDKNVPENFIDVETDHGLVTLSGTVDNLLAKDRAVQIAESIRGVQALINRIDVSPLSQPDDDTLTFKVITALASDPATDSYELTVETADGIVTLRGAVDSWPEKQLSEEVAKSIKGVKALKSQIIVEPDTSRPDSEIEADIIRRLQSDVWIHEKLIGLIVDRGKVTLTGSVGSLAEKHRAYMDAWVNGVTDVRMDRLKVEWWARDRMLRDPREVVTSQTQTEEALRTALTYDPRLKDHDLSVRVVDGTAILAGIVQHMSAKLAAEETAKNTVGIWRVRNHIKVRPPEWVQDEFLENRVRGALNNNPIVDRYDLKISAKQGTVSLGGFVNSHFEVAQAVRTVAGVKGVTEIENFLEVSPSGREKHDEEIWEEIRRTFWWDPRLYNQDIIVSVQNGVVTLKGTVPTIVEWRRARTIAMESGANRVRNQLKVIYGPAFLSS